MITLETTPSTEMFEMICLFEQEVRRIIEPSIDKINILFDGAEPPFGPTLRIRAKTKHGNVINSEINLASFPFQWNLPLDQNQASFFITMSQQCAFDLLRLLK